MTQPTTPLALDDVAALAGAVIDEVAQAIVGKRTLLHQMMTTILAGGHILLEDFPGLAKTLTAQSFATALGLDFKRIQFTPDLLPGDITGSYIFDRNKGEFVLRQGPIFANIILADEINRASPKTQSALLEAMQEQQVTLEGETKPLPAPFIVMATQNPIEYEGTFPLPEAQVDRFMLRIHLGYPSKADEIDVLNRQRDHHPIGDLGQVISVEELVAAQQSVNEIYVDDLVKNYIVDVVTTTRDHPEIYLGASPRGSLALFKTARAWAALEGRDFVLPDDIKLLATPALAHRLIVSPSARIKNITPQQIVEDALRHTPVPGARARLR